MESFKIEGTVQGDGRIKLVSKTDDKFYVDPVAMAEDQAGAAQLDIFKSCFLANKHTSNDPDSAQDSRLEDLLAEQDKGQGHLPEGSAAAPDSAVAGGPHSKGSFPSATGSDVTMEGETGKRKRDQDAEIDTHRDSKGKRPAS